MKKLLLLPALLLIAVDAYGSNPTTEVSCKPTQIFMGPTQTFAQRATPLRRAVAKKLQKAQAVIEAEQLVEGIEILNEILEMRRLTDYERAHANYFFAYVAYLKEDYRGAINYYNKVLVGEAPRGLLINAKNTITQLYFQLENWCAVIAAVDQLIFEVEYDKRPDLNVLKASALYQQKRYKELIPVIKKAIYASPKTNENWLRLLRTAYFEISDKDNEKKILERLMNEWPKNEYSDRLKELQSPP